MTALDIRDRPTDACQTCGQPARGWTRANGVPECAECRQQAMTLEPCAAGCGSKGGYGDDFAFCESCAPCGPDEPIDPTLDAACRLMYALGDDPDEIARAIMFISRVVTHESPDPHGFAVGMSAVSTMAGEVAHGFHSRKTCGDQSPCVKSAPVIDLAGARDN